MLGCCTEIFLIQSTDIPYDKGPLPGCLPSAPLLLLSESFEEPDRDVRVTSPPEQGRCGAARTFAYPRADWLGGRRVGGLARKERLLPCAEPVSLSLLLMFLFTQALLQLFIFIFYCSTQYTTHQGATTVRILTQYL